MNDIDFERALTLMQVIANVANISPMSTHIAGEAQAELKAIDDACKENADERSAETKQADDEAHYAEQARLREEHPLETIEDEPEAEAEPKDDLLPKPAPEPKPSNGRRI